MLFRKAVQLGLIRFNKEDEETTSDSKATGGGGGGSGRRQRAPGSVVARLIGRFGDAETALAVVAGENYGNRATIRDLEAKLATVGSKAPKEGQLVLSREQAAEWEAYQALGKPTELGEKLTTLEGQVAEAHAQSVLTEALEAAGLKNRTVLSEILKARDLKLVMKDGVPFIRPITAAESEAGEKLTDYIDAKAADYKVVLMGGTNGGSNGQGPTRKFPATPGGDSKGQQTGDKVTERLERRMAALGGSSKSET